MTIVKPASAVEPPAPSVLERRYRKLLLAYPRHYRTAYGDELLDVLLADAAGRTGPPPKEVWGLLLGGVRSRILHQATGNAWADGLHLAVTAVTAANLAALLPYAGTLPLWTLLSALALLAVQRGRLRTAFALTLVTGVKAAAIAAGRPAFDLTVLPVYPNPLGDRPLFGDSSPLVAAAGYAVALIGLLVLISRSRAPRVRSWWWWAAIVPAAWAGPAWMAEEAGHPLSLSRMAAEVTAFGLAAVCGYLARDHRWAFAASVYLLATSGGMILHAPELTKQHLAYEGVLVLLALAAAFAPFRHRRHCLD
ncbi:hypothetical protein [Nonomuraea ferruginea]|uniref:Uncharacterized protein n=1 Tax=Nonomuraea ferruginea TaxID=46174 RepID=A0ABT4T0D7_9ACTN|nr:hypothetical protein [Nonomuraea ferruginea]MDA0642506.1 hypothetical protein [Nonomuraea ferruginea]